MRRLSEGRPETGLTLGVGVLITLVLFSIYLFQYVVRFLYYAALAADLLA